MNSGASPPFVLLPAHTMLLILFGSILGFVVVEQLLGIHLWIALAAASAAGAASAEITRRLLGIVPTLASSVTRGAALA